MNGGKGLLISLFSFIGTFALVTPTCLGWFYEPKRPDELESK
ncbi:MAG: cyclic lactone autoinducer peptide [Desulfitobacterium sp.]|nr:cyclic lactone autoinducer peptide [Desulfitobacterium sp.]